MRGEDDGHIPADRLQGGELLGEDEVVRGEQRQGPALSVTVL